MEIKINVDLSSMSKRLEDQMKKEAENTAASKITHFFAIRKDFNHATRLFEITSGIGAKDIEEHISKKYLTADFQDQLDQFFEENWKRIFEEAMTKALQHKANGIAFNKVHALKIN